jgi:hypothetical protein
MAGQIGEKLILNGKEVALHSLPGLPLGHPRLREYAANDKRSLASPFGATLCTRGYQGTWEIRDGTLYIRAVGGRYELIGEEPLFANWVSAKLSIPMGRAIGPVTVGFGPRHSSELSIEVASGRVVDKPASSWS